MNTNVNFEAASGVLLFLGAGLLVFVLGAMTFYGLIKQGRRKWARRSGSALACMLAFYTGLVLVFSVQSRDHRLARGEEKYFCEIDCHLAYSVMDVRRAKTVGDPPSQATAAGTFYIVTVKTRFDEQTISPTRGNMPLTPNLRRLAVYDEQGRSYGLSPRGQRALELAGGSGTPLATPLRPGEAYTSTLVFDLPDQVRNATLLINEAMLPTLFIVGHENSPWHGRTFFRLDSDDAILRSRPGSSPLRN